jgi:hypothetical protein
MKVRRSVSLRSSVFHIPSKDWSDAVGSVAEVDEEAEVQRSMLDYVRRYGAAMGMRMYEYQGRRLAVQDELAA